MYQGSTLTYENFGEDFSAWPAARLDDLAQSARMGA
jgi:hypothetical protein